MCPDADGNDDGRECPLGDVRAAHGYWLNMAREGILEGGLRGGLKIAAGIIASTILDFGGATAIDDGARVLADPDAGTGDKVTAGLQIGAVVAGYTGAIGANAVAQGIRSGALQEVGHATRLVGHTGYRGSRIYGIRNTAGQAPGTDRHGFYFAIDKAGHLLHIGKWALFKR